MKPLILFLLLSTAAWGQDKPTISKSETVQQDTIPVTLLVRISGRPWAFFHDGWEVRKVDTLPIMIVERLEFGKKTTSPYPKVKYSHLLYLDSRKRPIRKEWVVYDKYSRK